MDMSQAVEEVIAFRDERDWKQFHTPKNLAISLCIESSELLEIFQWSDTKEIDEQKKERIEEELADVLIYAIYLADSIGVELPDIILKKVETNRKKYPVEKASGTSKKYTEL